MKIRTLIATAALGAAVLSTAACDPWTAIQECTDPVGCLPYDNPNVLPAVIQDGPEGEWYAVPPVADTGTPPIP